MNDWSRLAVDLRRCKNSGRKTNCTNTNTRLTRPHRARLSGSVGYQRLRRGEQRGQLRLSLTNTYHEWPDKRPMVRYDAPPLHVNASLSRGDIRGVAAAISADRARCEIRRRRLRSFQLIRRKWPMGTALSEPGDTSRELLGRSGVAALIPDIRIGEVEFGFWRNDQFSGHTGRALVALCLATIVPKPGPGKDGLSGAPVLVLATRGRVLPRGWPRGRPRDLPLAGAFLPGSDQKSKFQYRSLHPPSVHSLRYGAPP